MRLRTLYEPGDEQNGGWSREQLENMNARFSERLEEAFRLYDREHRPAARELLY